MDEGLSEAVVPLVRHKLLSVENAKNYQSIAYRLQFRLIDYLTANSILGFRDIAVCYASYFDYQFVDLDKEELAIGVQQLLTKDLVRKYNVFPLYIHDTELYLAIDDPTRHNLIQDLKFHISMPIVLLVVEANKLTDKINKFVYTAEKIGYTQSYQDPLTYTSDNYSSSKDSTNEALIKLVDLILNQAIAKGASDIHFEPYAERYQVRYRIDGVLHNTVSPENYLAVRICARLKVLANLNLAEHRIPQDGRFTFMVDSLYQVDCRVSICPTINGEKVVIRLLNSSRFANLTIDSLTMPTRDKVCFLNAINKSQGLILVTGPTGSGKSTTLYAGINHLHTESVNIITVEDPVEYKVSGVNQVQVNSSLDLSFARVLRSLLRQDPDIIMIGEIRDLETAQIAIQASQTGHLVLSSIHTNTSAQTLQRLINIGIPVFNLLNSLRLIVAQRLLRKLCRYCREPREDLTEKVLISLGYGSYIDSIGKFYRAIGCSECNAGYKGRVAIFEMLLISEAVADLLLSSDCNSNKIEQLACQEGMQLIKQAGFKYVMRGVTSIEELQRVM